MNSSATACRAAHYAHRPFVQGLIRIVICSFVPCAAVPVEAALLTPRAAVIKPGHTEVDPAVFRTDVVWVRFREGLIVRLRGGKFTDLGGADLGGVFEALAAHAPFQIERVHALPEARLDQLRAVAETKGGKAIADLNLEYFVRLPNQTGASNVIDALNALDCVELAGPVPLPIAAPVPPNFQPNQGYLGAATAGVGATCMWQVPGGTGANNSLGDLEYSWNLNHLDFPGITLLGAAPTDPFNNDNHGTAVLGSIVALNDGVGVTGLVHGATAYVAAVNTGGIQNVAGAITTALGTLVAGDVLLIEQQLQGPNYTGIPAGTQFGLVPVEWSVSIYNAILTAIGNGIIVVEAGGNGTQNLDAAVYSTGNGGHWPFLPANDSGAIIVGAGAVPGGTDTDRSRLGFSNYGSTVDLQGWGEKIYSTGYGDAYNAEGKNRWYTATFSGTSGASPIVASACVALQSAHFAANGTFLTPAQARAALVNTGSAQQAGTFPVSQNIGPRPNAPAALCSLVGAMDSNGNLVPDRCDGLPGLQACCLPGGCVDTTVAHCNANGGAPQGAGTSCLTTQCPVTPTEACCAPNGVCTDVVPATCLATNGIPQGPGTTCLGTACAAYEACCLPGGACADMPMPNCLLNNGTSQGPGTTCATTACITFEACCVLGMPPTCFDAPVMNCQIAGGIPQGPGSSCANTPCPILFTKFSQLPAPNRENIPSNIDINTLVPNVVIADDFQSDGRPVYAVRWWGSYIDPRFQPTWFGGLGAPFQVDGWLISFHEPLSAGLTPPQPPLGLYFAPASAVSIRQALMPSCDGHVVYEYVVQIRRCCRLHFHPDSRSGWTPAQFEAFEEQHCFNYDIDIEAVVGGAYQSHPQTGLCVPPTTVFPGPGANFWGWHSTDQESGSRSALMSMTIPGPWIQGPWNPALPLCSLPPVNMAFELLTENPATQPPCPQPCCMTEGACIEMMPEPCVMVGGDPQGSGQSCIGLICPLFVPKFEQPITPMRENHPSQLDWNAIPTNRVLADDFQSDGRPITRVRWWGSYLDPRYQPTSFGGLGAPHAIDGWLLSFHEPLVAGGGGPPMPPLGLYFAPADRVRIRPAPIPSCEGHPVYEFTINIAQCCLLHGIPDTRSGLIPAQSDAFYEQHCYWYDLDVQALIGHVYSRDALSGACISAASSNIAELPETWGWHATDLEFGQRGALMSHLVMAGMNWMYGPWLAPPPRCSPQPINMAFALLTSDPLIPQPCGCDCDGDVDDSNAIDGDDVQAFVDCFLSGSASGNCNCANLNDDPVVDEFDVPLFVDRLLTTTGPCP